MAVSSDVSYYARKYESPLKKPEVVLSQQDFDFKERDTLTSFFLILVTAAVEANPLPAKCLLLGDKNI